MTVLGEYHQAVGELIHRFGGTVGAFAGDAIQVFFNDPLPCPDPAVQAVRMALAIRQTMLELCRGWARRGHRLGFGAAITLGYATLGQIGFAGRVDYAAVGPVVDLADQLSASALAGELLITQTLYAAVESEVDVTALGERSLPGFSRPVDVFRVEQAQRGNSVGLLSSREREVAILVARGLTNRQIAEHLIISERTAEGHVDHIRDKLGVHTRAEIAAWVAHTGLAPQT
jgi:class 3 adenylate cyclase